MVLLFITVLCPLGMVIATIRMEDIQELLEAGQLKTMLSHSIVVTGIERHGNQQKATVDYGLFDMFHNKSHK